MNNRLWNARNPYQGRFRRALCVCSAGLLRSPTIAWVLSQDPFNFNTRAVGSDPSFALVPIDDVLIHWADVVVFVNKENHDQARIKYAAELDKKDVVILNIQDSFEYREPTLVRIAKEQLTEADRLYGDAA